MSNQIVTPAQIEKRLYDLSKDIDDAHADLTDDERTYHTVKTMYEIGMAKSRMEYATKSAPNGKNYTVQEREDLALIANEAAFTQLNIVEARVKASRANVNRIKTQVEIARSIGTSVRTSLDLA